MGHGAEPRASLKEERSDGERAALGVAGFARNNKHKAPRFRGAVFCERYLFAGILFPNRIKIFPKKSHDVGVDFFTVDEKVAA